MVTFWVITVPLGYINTLYPRFLSSYFMAQANIKVDNVNPREQSEAPEVTQKDTNGYIHRSIAAHNNGWEAMNMWTAAVLVANARNVDTDTINAVAGVWLAARILYNPAYIFVTSPTVSLLRSGLFVVTLVCCQYLLWSAIRS